MTIRRIRAAKLIDRTGAAPVANAAVLIDGERIVALGPDASVPCPDFAERLDVGERTLLPGLVDCHSHLNLPGDGTSIEDAAALGDDLLLLQSAENARTTLLSGVTSLRDNGARHATTFAVKEAIRRKIITGPHLSISGRPITMTGGHCWPFGGEADGTDGVRAAVRRMVKEGADWIKVMATGGGTLNTMPYRPSFTAAELRVVVDVVVLNVTRGLLKERNLRRDPRLSLCIEDGMRYVTLEGRAELVADRAQQEREVNELIAPRYLGARLGSQRWRVIAGSDRVGIRMRVEKVRRQGV